MATASSFEVPSTCTPSGVVPLRISAAFRAASCPRSTEREPMITCSPARPSRSARPKPSSPVPPTIAMLMPVLSSIGSDRHPADTDSSGRAGGLPRRRVDAEDLAQRVADLAEGGPSLQRVAHRRQHVAGPTRRLAHGGERALHGRGIAGRPEVANPLLLRLHLGLVQNLELDRLVAFVHVPVDADDSSRAVLDPTLDPVRGVGD